MENVIEQGTIPIMEVSEGVERPETLEGTTYMIKSPVCDHAIHITINDIVLESGIRRPWEIFINSKEMDYFQWVAALARMLSAIFRKGGDYHFIIDELKVIADPNPKGHYFSKGTHYESTVSHIATILEEHFKKIEALRL